jgi:hypothetical protein
MIGSGTKFHRSDDGVAFTRIANILDLSPPEQTRSSSEKSYLDDETGFKTFEPGMTDPGEMTLALEFDTKDSGQVALKADKETKGNFYYKIEYPDLSTEVFQAHITGWGKSVPKEETIQRTVKFKLSGQTEETAAP